MLEKYDLVSKCMPFLHDNCSTIFGGVARAFKSKFFLENCRI
jgi:hypothetical protein